MNSERQRAVSGSDELQHQRPLREVGVRLLGRDDRQLVRGRPAQGALPGRSRRGDNPTSALYYDGVEVHPGRPGCPKGIAVMAGGLYWPTQGFPLDHDVRSYFGMDHPQVMVDVNLLFDPMFDVQVLRGRRQADGVRGHRRCDADLPEGARRRCPSGEGYPIQDRATWEKLKAERTEPERPRAAVPAELGRAGAGYRNRDYPLAIEGYPHGFFGTLAHLMGYETLFYIVSRRAGADPRHPRHLHRPVDRRLRRGAQRRSTWTTCTSGRTSPTVKGPMISRAWCASSCSPTTSGSSTSSRAGA